MVSFLRREVFPDQERILIEKIIEREREGYVRGVPEVEDHEAGSLCGGKIEVVAEIV